MIKRQKIELYVVRTFGEKFSATFDFISDNWRVLLRFLTYIYLPMAVVLALFTYDYMDMFAQLEEGASEAEALGVAGKYGLATVLYGLAYIASTGAVYGLMRQYFSRAEGLNGLSWRDFQPVWTRGMMRGLNVTVMFWVAMLGVVIVAALLALLSRWLLLPVAVALVVCLVPLALLCPAYMLEDNGLWASVGKAYRLGFRTWGGIVLTLLVVGIISYLLAIAVSLPWYVCIGLKTVFVYGAADGEAPSFISSSAFSFLSYLASIVQIFGALLLYTIGYVACAFLYGHAAEKVDAVTANEGIERFEQLGDSNANARQPQPNGDDDAALLLGAYTLHALNDDHADSHSDADATADEPRTSPTDDPQAAPDDDIDHFDRL